MQREEHAGNDRNINELLKSLGVRGDYEVNHFLRTKPGFHELDIEAFVQKLKRLAPSVNNVGVPLPKCVRFSIVACGRYASVAVKANIVRAMLSRELPVIGNADGTGEGLLLRHEEFHRLANDERARANGDARTPAEASQQLQCDPSSIPGLVEMGLLRDELTRKGLRITEESIAKFKKRYVSLASIAKTIDTSSRALIGFCKTYEIPIVVAGRQWQKAKQGFVFRQEMRKRLGFRSNRTQGLRPRWESAA